MELTPRQLKTLEKYKKVAAAELVGKGSLPMIDYMVELEEHVDTAVEEVKALYPDLIEVLEEVRRDIKGESGEDADNEYILEELTKRIPEAAKIDEESIVRRVLTKIRIPKDGDDGVVDYDLAVSEVLKRIPLPENGKDGSSDTAEDIRNKLELLLGDDRLSAEFISGLDKREEAVLNRAIEILDRRTQYLINKQTAPSLTLTTNGSSGPSTYINGVLNIPTYPGAAGVTIFNDTVSGTINGSNKIFTVTNTIGSPIALYLANSVYQSTVDYAVSGTTITYVTAPDASLAGQPHFFAHT